MPKSIPGVMREYKAGKLHSGSSTGPRVTNPKQAIAIALSEQHQMAPRTTRAHRSHGLRAAYESHPHAVRLGKFLHPKGGY
jgi:hypothetical protein